ERCAAEVSCQNSTLFDLRVPLSSSTMKAARLEGKSLVLILLLLPAVGGDSVATEGRPSNLFVATALTRDGAFTAGIEGPACDREGNIFAVNFAKQQTIGKVTPTGQGEIFVELPGKSTGNGIA